MAGSMMADIADEHELETGLRREGIFFGAMSFIGKASAGIGAQLAGVLLDLVGLVPGTDPSAVEPATWRTLGMTYALTFGALMLAGMFAMRRYGITRKRHAEIHALIAGGRPS